uniref:Uncharacterized protein n=1 Tax=Anopheles epiroticus TaxID=199890 RepID=A0A182P713_9DIPT
MEMANNNEMGMLVKDPTSGNGLDGGPSSASEITIIMRTVMSSPGGGVGTGAKNELAPSQTVPKRADPTDRDSALRPSGNRIEVTTSVRTVFECPGPAADSGSSGASGAAATAISNLLQPVLSKNFIALLKSANDSSFENVLEFKSLLGTGLSSGAAARCPSCEHSKHALSSDSDTTTNDLEASVQKKVKTEEIPRAAKAHVCEDDFAHRPTSTPIKIRIVNGESADGQIRYDGTEEAEKYRLNLLTPPADASFIDSDFESMEQDQYDTCSSKSSPRPDHKQPELTAQRMVFEELAHPRDSVVSMEVAALTVNRAGQKSEEANCTLTRAGGGRKSSSTTKAFFEEALRTPLAIRKHFQRRRNSELPKQPSHSNLLNFFSAKKKSNSLEGGLKSPRAKRSLTTTATTTTSENSSENGSRCTSPALTEDNLRRLSVSFVRRESDCLNRTLVWGENYDYSYECEPSHSDVEEGEEPEEPNDDGDDDDDANHSPLVGTIGNGRTTERRVSTKLVHFEISPDSSYELQPPILPSFRIDPPRTGACSTSTGLAGLIIGAAAYATATTTASFLKRSASEPAHCNKLRSHSCTPLTSDIGESDEEEPLQERHDRASHDVEEVPMMCKALVPQRPFTSVHQASVRSLDKIGVSVALH